MAPRIRDFKDLDAWQVARDFRTEVYKLAHDRERPSSSDQKWKHELRRNEY